MVIRMKKIKSFIYSICKNNVFFRKCAREVKYFLEKRKYAKYKNKYKTDEKLVLFECFDGRSYADSPKAMYLEMLKNKKYKDYHFIWCFNDVESKEHKVLGENRNTSLVKSGSAEYFIAFAKAKYWIVNAKVNDGIVPRNDQVFVQTWHGTPLKKLRCDIEVDSSFNSVSEIRRRNDIDSKRYSYFISPSKFCTDKFNSSFNLLNLHKKNIIIEKGYPRNDFLFNFKDNDIKSIKAKLGIKSNKKIILYAPTFRDNQRSSYEGYTYNLGVDFDKWKKSLSKDYIILFRTHYFISNSIDLSKYKDFIYDVSSYDDVNDLYVISDLIITDYSSVFFDYANLKRPMLFYMYDKEEYKEKMRDFYIDLEELPGPITEKEDDLLKEIKNISSYDKKYNKKYDLFNKKYNYLDGSDCSRKVLEVIIDE